MLPFPAAGRAGQAQLAEWLSPRGLSFNEAKTRVVHLEEGFEFLGCGLRRYRRGNRPGKLLIKPSATAVRRIRKRLTDEARKLRGSNARAVIARLNPIIRGWAAYYRGVVSSEVFHKLDAHVWWLVYRWARHRHSNKSKRWVVSRYFGKFNKARNDRWVFGDRDGATARGQTPYLVKFSWTPIVRHQLVVGGASPDDPDLFDYWAKRRKKVKPPLDDYNLRLLTWQAGRCPLCRENLITADQPPQSPREWERWWLSIVHRALVADHLTHERTSTPNEKRTRLVHTSCYRAHRARESRKPAPSSRP